MRYYNSSSQYVMSDRVRLIGHSRHSPAVRTCSTQGSHRPNGPNANHEEFVTYHTFHAWYLVQQYSITTVNGRRKADVVGIAVVRRYWYHAACEV